MPPSTGTPTNASPSAAPPRHAYQATPASSDRTQRCANRNGIWPPLYKRQWNPHPARSLAKSAQRRFERCVLDAVEAGEFHRTTANVVLAFSRASDDRLSDVWIAQRTIAERLHLAESTVCHHVAIAKRLGWIAVQHRNRVDNGFVVGMSNVTRLQLPAHWQAAVDEQDRQRRAAQTRARRQHGPADRRRPARPGTERTTPTEAHSARSTGAALAQSTPTFEAGRLELERIYHGKPADLYETAYASFDETWRKLRTVRKNE